MKIHEYQAKDLFSKNGIPVPKGEIASTPEDAKRIAEGFGGSAVVKAQVHAGGRGNAGGIKLVTSPEQAQQVTSELLGTNLVTNQTGPEGVPIKLVLVEETADIVRELYLSITTDASAGGHVIIASEAGGMAIEDVASETPEKILREPVDIVVGFQPYQGRRLAYALNLHSDQIRPAAQLIGDLYKVFATNDCSLVEINPLISTSDGSLVALDAKMDIDDDAIFRHPELRNLRDVEQEDPLEVEASKYDINYIHLEGDVGCVVNGAGLAMATMDVTRTVGSEPANFLDIGGGADEEKVAQAINILLSDPKVKRIMVNIFGGILRCDVAARGIVLACKEREDVPPIVVRMRGTNVEEGLQILSEANLPITLASNLTDAAEKIRQVGERTP